MFYTYYVLFSANPPKAGRGSMPKTKDPVCFGINTVQSQTASIPRKHGTSGILGRETARP